MLGDDSEVTDSEAEETAEKLSHEVAGNNIVGDERLFLSSTGKLHVGRPGSAFKTLCGESIDSMTQQASGFLEQEDNLCLKCYKPLLRRKA